MAGRIRKSSKNEEVAQTAPENKADEPEIKLEEEIADAETPPKAKGKVPSEESDNNVSFAPKTFLTPYVLLMLRDTLLHGYAIWEKLMFMGIPGLNQNDRATIYRTLRQLEKEGKITSEWETPSGGPARRVYALTGSGEEFLRLWAMGLDQYRQSLDFFFKLYAGGLANPFGLGFYSPPKNNKDKEDKH